MIIGVGLAEKYRRCSECSAHLFAKKVMDENHVAAFLYQSINQDELLNI